MANSITLAKAYTQVVDEVYKAESKSTVLNSNAGLARAGANAKEILVPKVSVTGLGDYTRNGGYTQGAVSLDFETVTFDYDRGMRIVIDAMDATEAGLTNAFTAACSELQRTQVAPEGDAYTFAKICGKAGISDVVPAGETFADGKAVIDALNEAMTKMDEAEVSGSRYLFITPTLHRLVKAYNVAVGAVTTAVMDEFAGVVDVPQSRFYTAVKLNDGKEAFGYAKAEAGKELNFLIVEKSAVIKFDKHVASRVFSPDELENLDSYMQKYRKYGIVDVFDNKVAGVAMCHKA